MTITVNPTPLAPVGNAIQLFCVGETPTIAELIATGTNVQWYANQLDAINAINPIPNTTLLINDATYYASQTANGCESSDFLSVQVKFNDPQITASETTVCSGAQVSLTASTTALINNIGLPTNLQNGLVGYWPFNGNANDSSGNGNNGTVNGAILTSDRFGTTNKAYTFDGNDYIEIQDSPSLNFSDQFSLSFYVKNEEPVGGWYMCVNKDNWGESGIVTFIAENKFFYSKPEHAGWIISTDLSANSWDLITITNNNGLSTLYKNGQFIMSDTIPIINNSESLVFGGSHNGGVIGSFKGILDDIIIWNRSLSLSEVQQLYTPAPAYLWSTGETTAIINPTPTETTTYWCDVTVDGVTCRKEMTITVNPLNTYYADADGDGFGSGAPVLLCLPTPPTGYAMNNLDCNDGLSTLTTSCVVTLPLKVLIQGYFKGSDQMTPVRKNAGLSSSNDEVDAVTVALYSPSNINQAVTTTTVVLATNGNITAQFDTTLLTESQYYIAIQHKNTIKTWSATPVAITNGTTYDFTTAASQAYGNNQIEVASGIYAIYSGDMNQDGTINEADLPIFTTANTTAAHGYIVSDLNGDGSVDLLDYPIYKNNAAASVNEVRPLPLPVIPTLTTTEVSNITTTAAITGGTITSDGGANVTARGIVWSTSPSPTIAIATKTTDGTGTGTFTSTLTGLAPATTYYVRAYATNAAGTAYGNEVSFITNERYVGELYGGGIVVSVWDTDGVQHGLIASLTDLGRVTWTKSAFYTRAIGTTARSFDDGFANTNAIVSQAGAGTTYAAGLCKAYNAGGYTDWYLPARNELQQCYNSRQTINTVLGSNGFQSSSYWSSTENGSSYAWNFYFNDGNTSSNPKNFPLYYVRAVRAF
jgi:hypothetical protein